jgi:hypothetical protein
MKATIPAMMLALFAGSARAESVYTKIDPDACKVLEQEGDSIRSVCAGWGGYPVEFAQGDLRQSLFFGHLGDWAKKAHFESFGPFNHMGGTAEWIVEGKVAKAAIMRFFIENSNPDTGEIDDKSKGQVLVIYKVGQTGEGEACVVGYVDARANPNPNDLARKVAASEVKGFACRMNEPQWHGIKGPLAGDAMRHFEEMAVE